MEKAQIPFFSFCKVSGLPHTMAFREKSFEESSLGKKGMFRDFCYEEFKCLDQNKCHHPCLQVYLRMVANDYFCGVIPVTPTYLTQVFENLQ